MILFVNAINAVHVSCAAMRNIFVTFPRGYISSNITLGEYYHSRSPLLKSKPPIVFKTFANQQGLFNIMSLDEQRKTRHATNNLNYQLGY